MKHFLITGSSGFIGSNLSNFFELSGHRVTRLDLREGSDIQSDLREIDWSLVDLSSYDGVVHLAAKISVPESFEVPEIYYEVNVESTRRLFASCVNAGVPRIAFASSAAVYGDVEGSVMKIGWEGAPLSPYAESKLEGERIAKELSTDDTKITCFRFFNVYGPGQSHKGQYASVIPLFVNKMIEQKKITIYGSGDQTRDFIHVDDISKVLLNSFFVESEPFSVYNLGSGTGVTINSLYRSIAKIIRNYSIEVRDPIYAIERKGDIEHSVADVSDTIQKFPNLITTQLTEGLTDMVGKILDGRDVVP